MNPQIIIAAVIAATAFAGGFGTAWKIQAGNINAKEAAHAKQELANVRSSAAADIRRLDNTIAAQNRSTARAVALRRDRDSALTELGRLRDAVNSAVPSTCDAASTGVESGSKRNIVLLECISSYEALARDADLWKNDALMLRDAWPK